MVKKRVRRGIEEVRNRVEENKDTIDKVMEGARGLVCDVWKNSPAQWIPSSDLLGVRSFYDNVVCDLDDEDKPKTDNDSIQKEEEEVPEELQNCDGAEFKITFFGNGLSAVDGFPDTCNMTTQNREQVVVAPVSSITYEKVNEDSASDRTVEAVIQDATGEKRVELFNTGIQGNQYFDGECPRTLSSHIIMQEWGIESIELENDPENRPECGAPEPPPPAPPYGEEDPVEENTFIDINIEGDDKFINKEEITINKDKRTVEGDKYEVYFEGDDIVFEYDSNDPPIFAPPDTDEFVGTPDIRDLLPDGLGDSIPTPGEFWRDVFDRLSDIVPSPLPGLSLKDILEAIEELEDAIEELEDEEEEEEPIEIDVARKSCEQGELKTTTETIEVMPSQERVVREIIGSQNRIEEVRCSVGAFKGVRVKITEFPVRGKARFGDSPEQSRFFFGWLQFTREGEMFGAPQILEFNPQTFPFPLEADDFTIQFIDGAEGETEVIELEENGEV